MRIAVFGGSGVCGRDLLPRLLAAGHEVRAMQHSSPVPDGCEVVAGGIDDPAAVAATIGDAEIVLQMTKGGAGVEQTVTTSCRGTINVLDVVQKSPGVTQYLLTSSDAAVGIYSHPKPEPVSHRTEPMSYGGYYSLGKVIEEVIVREYDRNGGVPFTIARLSYVMREDFVLGLLIANHTPGEAPHSDCFGEAQAARLAAGEKFIVLPLSASGGPMRRTVVELADVTAGLEAMIGNDAALHQVFHLSGPSFSFDEPCEYLAGKLGLPIEKVTVEGHPFAVDYSHTTDLLGWQPTHNVIASIDAALARCEA